MYISNDLFPLFAANTLQCKVTKHPYTPRQCSLPCKLHSFQCHHWHLIHSLMEQIVRSYSKFPLLVQGSLMHVPPIRVTVRFQPVNGDSDPLIVMELMQTGSPFGIATTILHVVYLMAHMRTNVSLYHLSLLFNLKSQHWGSLGTRACPILVEGSEENQQME